MSAVRRNPARGTPKTKMIGNITTLQYLALFIITIIIHELGHVVAFVKVHRKLPKIRFKWYGISVSEDKDRIIDKLLGSEEK